MGRRPLLTELERKNWFLPRTFHLLVVTVHNRNHMVPDRQGSAAHEIQKIIESTLG